MTVAAEPLRAALLEQSRAEAERVLARADEQAATKLSEAEEQGRALVERAQKEGAAAAAIAGAYEEARARRRAHALVLEAKRELYDELCSEARTAARALHDDPCYPELLERLSARARHQLGTDAVLEIDSGAGGVRASYGARHVDYTLDALVERCLKRLGSQVETLWH